MHRHARARVSHQTDPKQLARERARVPLAVPRARSRGSAVRRPLFVDYSPTRGARRAAGGSAPRQGGCCAAPTTLASGVAVAKQTAPMARLPRHSPVFPPSVGFYRCICVVGALASSRMRPGASSAADVRNRGLVAAVARPHICLACLGTAVTNGPIPGVKSDKTLTSAVRWPAATAVVLHGRRTGRCISRQNCQPRAESGHTGSGLGRVRRLGLTGTL